MRDLDSIVSFMDRWLGSLVRLCSLYFISICLAAAAAAAAVLTLFPW